MNMEEPAIGERPRALKEYDDMPGKCVEEYIQPRQELLI